MKPKSCLSIAGSDPGGGAGVQGDLKTFCAHDVYGMAVITALTVQNTESVKEVYPVPPQAVGEQLRHLYQDLPWDAAKTGMLYSSEIIREITAFLHITKIKAPLVVDPVLVSSSGDDLAADDLVASYLECLAPIATLLTPNAYEAARLTRLTPLENRDGFVAACEFLVERGARAVLLKGGDFNVGDRVVHDLLFIAGEKPIWFEHERVATKNSHGTGCALSAAIACNLSHGLPLVESVTLGREYVRMALIQSYPFGNGNPSINHLWKKNLNSPAS